MVATKLEVPELHEDRNLSSFGNSPLQAGSSSIVAPQPMAAETSPAATKQRVSPLPAPSLVTSSDRQLLAPMPGLIVRCEKTLGEEVEIGNTVLLLEAMKMDNPITAPISGKVISICNKGEKVKKGDVLAVIGKTGSRKD